MIGDSCIWKVVYIIWLDNPDYNLRLSQPNRASAAHKPKGETQSETDIHTGGKNPFVWIAKPMQNFPHLLSM